MKKFCCCGEDHRRQSKGQKIRSADCEKTNRSGNGSGQDKGQSSFQTFAVDQFVFAETAPDQRGGGIRCEQNRHSGGGAERSKAETGQGGCGINRSTARNDPCVGGRRFSEHLPEEVIVNRCDHRHFQNVGTLYCKCQNKEYAKEDT